MFCLWLTLALGSDLRSGLGQWTVVGRMCVTRSVGDCFHSGHLGTTPGLEHCCSSCVPETTLVWVLRMAIRQCHLHCIHGTHTVSWPHSLSCCYHLHGGGENYSLFMELCFLESESTRVERGGVKAFVSVIFWRKMLKRCSTPSLWVHRQEGSPTFRMRQAWEKDGSYRTYISLTETSILCTVPRWSRAPNSVPFSSLVVSQAAVIKCCGYSDCYEVMVAPLLRKPQGSYSFVFSSVWGQTIALISLGSCSHLSLCPISTYLPLCL